MTGAKVNDVEDIAECTAVVIIRSTEDSKAQKELLKSGVTCESE